MHFNIQKKILCITALIFLIAFCANTWVNGIYFSSEYTNARKSEVFTISHTLKSQLDRLLKMHIPVHQLEGFEEMCQEILTEHTYLSYAMVMDTEGKILFHNDPAWHGQSISDTEILKGAARAEDIVLKSLISGEEYYDFFVPVFGGGTKHIATIRTGFPASAISEKIKTLGIYSFSIAAFFILFGILLFITLLNLWVSRPIQQFIYDIKHISKNWSDDSLHVKVGSKDEIGQLADAFNQMTGELRKTTVSKEYMDNIIGNMLNSLIVLDTDLTIQSVNKASLNLLGYDEDELVGQKLRKVLIHSKELDKIEKETAIEMTYLSKTGEEIPVLFSVSILKDKHQYVQGIICVAQDITGLKEAETEKINAQNIAHENKKLALIGQVAGKMAHDFNNILGGIMGLSELSLMDCEDEDMKETFDIIFKQTLRGKNLTKNLVAFAKSQELKQEFFNINEKAEFILELMKKDLLNVNTVCETDDTLPDLLADPGMIEHAIMNILQNSIHAVSKNEQPAISIRTFFEDEHICIEIEDNGCGIPEKYLESIYDPSFTLKGSRDRIGAYPKSIKGTGYGMSNVKKYLDQHKGSISLTSEAGSGTKCTLRLPVIRRELSEEQKQSLTKNAVHSKKNILIMEDEPAISDVQFRILTQAPCFHFVDITDNGKDAIKLFEKNRYDVISLDYLVPGKISGIDVYHHIRKTDSNVPVLFASGNIDFLESIEKLKQKDPYLDHLSKPCSNLDYVNTIHSLVEKLSA